MNVNNRTVFISGSNSGIGKATLELFAQHGWNVLAHSREKKVSHEEYLNEIASANQINIQSIYFDMLDEEEMKKQIKENISKPKVSIDAIINNAGICDIKLFMMTPVSDIRKVFEVNLFSHMRLTQLLLKRIITGGSIVNVSSVDGIRPNQGETAYASSKAAMLAWTKVLQSEFLGKIRVNAVAPYAVDTDLARAIEEQANWSNEQLLDPREVANVIYYLSSDRAVGISGEIIEIAGKQF